MYHLQYPNRTAAPQSTSRVLCLSPCVCCLRLWQQLNESTPLNCLLPQTYRGSYWDVRVLLFLALTACLIAGKVVRMQAEQVNKHWHIVLIYVRQCVFRVFAGQSGGAKGRGSNQITRLDCRHGGKARARRVRGAHNAKVVWQLQSGL